MAKSKNEPVTKRMFDGAVETISRQTKGMVMDATEAVLNGVDAMFKEQDRRNEKKFATKEDLKREVSWLRDDINGLRAELSDTPTLNWSFNSPR